MELLKEANELPAREQIAEEEEARKMRFERETGRRNKGKRVSAPPAFEVDEDVLRNRSALFENSFTMPSALNSQNVQPSNVQTPSFFSVQNTEPIRVEAPYSKREDTPELPEDPQYTTLGDGKYSDSDPSSEEEEENINVPPLKRMEPKSDVPSAVCCLLNPTISLFNFCSVSILHLCLLKGPRFPFNNLKSFRLR